MIDGMEEMKTSCHLLLFKSKRIIDMGSEIAPSAPFDVDIVELAKRICNEDFYREDYRETALYDTHSYNIKINLL